jgi:hypothetical protein
VSGAFALIFGIVFGIFTAIRRRDGFAANAIMTISLIGVSLPTFLIGILLIYLFAVELGWLPSFGRGDVVDLGWWSTGFLTAIGAEGADPAVDHAGALPDDADHAAGALRDAGGAAHRLHPLCPGARPEGTGDQFPPRAEEHAGAGDHHHRPAAGLDHRVCHHHRDGVPVAGRRAACSSTRSSSSISR